MNEISEFLLGYGGPILLAIVFVEQAGLPLPSAPWLLAAGALSASGKLNPVVAVGVTVLGAMMADSLWFYVGRRGGQRVLKLFCRLSLSRNSCVGRSKNLFARHGFKALVASKFLPGLGTVMPPLAGALGMRTSRFLIFDMFGSLIYGSFYIGAGFLFHNQLGQVMGVLNKLGFDALLLGAVALTAYVGLKLVRRRRLGTAGTRQTQNANIIIGADHNSVASLPTESLNTLAIQNVSLLVTSSTPQAVGPHHPAPLQPCSP